MRIMKLRWISVIIASCASSIAPLFTRVFEIQLRAVSNEAKTHGATPITADHGDGNSKITDPLGPRRAQGIISFCSHVGHCIYVLLFEFSGLYCTVLMCSQSSLAARGSPGVVDDYMQYERCEGRGQDRTQALCEEEGGQMMVSDAPYTCTLLWYVVSCSPPLLFISVSLATPSPPLPAPLPCRATTGTVVS
jgi:hypothetical protein